MVLTMSTVNPHLKFLVVDDFSTMRRIVKNLLQELGYHNVQEADDGATALPMLNGYVIKPFTAQTLSEKLGKILQSRPAG
jgi:PleD family two-component response regulator